MIEVIILAHLIYDQSCCHERDCRPIPCEQVQHLRDGWLWNGMKFTPTMRRPAPDGQCHVCTSIGPLCIYLPMQTS